MRKCNKFGMVSVLLIITAKSFAVTETNTNLHSSGQRGLSKCYSANTLGCSRLALSFWGNFGYDPTMVSLLEKPLSTVYKPYAALYDLLPSVSFGVTDFLDVSVVQPFYFDLLEDALPSGAAGDLSIILKYRIPHKRKQPFEGAFLVDATIPYSNGEKGYFIRHLNYLSETVEIGFSDPGAFHTAIKPSFSFLGITTYTVKKLLFHANAGACIALSKRVDNAAIGALGVEFHPFNWLGLSTDLHCEPRFSSLSYDLFELNAPLHLSPAITLQAPRGALFSIGSIFSLSSRKIVSYHDKTEEMPIHTRIEPLWKLSVQLSWSGIVSWSDYDGDNVKGRKDRCPERSEDFDGFDDSDGCPEIDNDNDNIPDEKDSCQNVPEDFDGFEDGDGCPDYDNDGDGISDTLEKCSDEPEDKDGFNDDDGCPDPDNDADGIHDSLDKCINIAEDADHFKDEDGCPDYDNDVDGIPDSIDKCPDSAGVSEENGCPKNREMGKEIKPGRLILSGVHFDTGTTDLTSGSLVELERLYYSLIDWPDVKIEILAHTDNSLLPRQSLLLSQKRAESILEYLINKGVSSSRLTATGKGSTSPIADNKTIKGRNLNTRIEILRIDH